MMCRVCGVADNLTRDTMCPACYEVRQLALAAEPGTLLLVVDGSVSGKKKGEGAVAAGAGLVLARAEDEAVVAVCAAEFRSTSATQAEYQAVVRGLRWAPTCVAWTDSLAAIALAERSGHAASFIHDDFRDPLHNLAHRLANVARTRNYERLDRLWIPGAVW